MSELRVARVFPTKTSMSPTDFHAYFNEPELFMPEYNEIHVSVAFSWDVLKAHQMAKQWNHIAPVKIGGPAIDGEPTDGFKAGQYLKRGITITSRGCPFRCRWCFVRQDLIELSNFPKGNIVQDNNILACSKSHLDKVFQMLSHQKRINFSGGLDSRLITDETINQLRGLKIYQIWLSFDEYSRRKYLVKVIEKLKKYFSRNQIRCYVLIGFKDDTMEKAQNRLIEAWEMGTLPFAMLYRNRRGEYPQPKIEWKKYQRKWCRPAIIKSMVEEKFIEPNDEACSDFEPIKGWQE